MRMLLLYPPIGKFVNSSFHEMLMRVKPVVSTLIFRRKQRPGLCTILLTPNHSNYLCVIWWLFIDKTRHSIVWLPSTRELLFGFNAFGHCLVHVRMLHYLRVGSRITITQLHMHTMQQMHSHKTVTGRVEAKKLVSRRRQSEYNSLWVCPI